MALGLDAACAATAAHRHGTHVDHLFDAVRADPTLAARVSVEIPLCRGELTLAREEMTLTDEDIWRRRTPLSILGAAAAAG
jgi:glycerol-3-phosphate dehydrogenase